MEKMDLLAWFDRQIAASADAEDGSLTARLGLEAEEARTIVSDLLAEASWVVSNPSPQNIADLRAALSRVVLP